MRQGGIGKGKAPGNKALDPAQAPVILPSATVPPQDYGSFQTSELKNPQEVNSMAPPAEFSESGLYQSDRMGNQMAYRPKALPDMPDPDTIPIRPIPREKLDGREYGRKFLDKMFAYVPGMKAKDAAWVIAKKAEFTKRLEDLGANPTPEEMHAALMDMYENTMGPLPTPTMGFSPEAQAALDEAFADDPVVAEMGPQFLDQEELLAAAGYALGGLFTGRGIQDGLQVFNKVWGRGEARRNEQAQKAAQEAKLRRDRAIQKFKRQTEIDDKNFQQEGYEARDQRTQDREVMRNLLGGVRDEMREDSIRDRRLLEMATENYWKFLQMGDSARAQQVADFYEMQTGRPLADEFRKLDPTAKEEATKASTEKTYAEIDRMKEVVKGLKLDNTFKLESLPERIEKVAIDNEVSRQRLAKLMIEVANLDDMLKAKTMKEWASIEEIKKRGDAAMLRASAASIRASSGGTTTSSGGAGSSGGSDAAIREQRLRLGQMQTAYNTDIDNTRQLLNEARAAITNFEKSASDAELMRDTEGAKKLRDMAAKKRTDEKVLEKRLNDRMADYGRVVKQIEALTGVGK